MALFYDDEKNSFIMSPEASGRTRPAKSAFASSGIGTRRFIRPPVCKVPRAIHSGPGSILQQATTREAFRMSDRSQRLPGRLGWHTWQNTVMRCCTSMLRNGALQVAHG